MPTRTESEVLEQVVQEFKQTPITPESTRHLWKNIWCAWGSQIGLSLEVPDLNLTQEKLNMLLLDGRMLIYNPHRLSTVEGLSALESIFPSMEFGRTIRSNSLENTQEQDGWLSVESTTQVPCLNVLSRYLDHYMNARGLIGQTLNTYIIGAQSAKLLTGRYFDSDAEPKSLLVATKDTRAAYLPFRAGFMRDGRLSVYLLDPHEHNWAQMLKDGIRTAISV